MNSHSDKAHLSAWMDPALERIELTLADFLNTKDHANLEHSMRYAVLDGGKRLRPLLVLAGFEFASQHAAGEKCYPDLALRAACAVEMIHAYSLVHDDMPCMDDDHLRRGKPTVHVVYGQAQALLAGDALQALAFSVLVQSEHDAAGAQVQIALCRLLAKASGLSGMAGGQAIDLANIGKPMSLSELQCMHELKTGALLHASVMMGAACCAEAAPIECLDLYGKKLGLLFQVVDDILDVTQDSQTLGKTPGKDALNVKPTYVTALGLQQAQAYAQDLYQDARAILQEHAAHNQHLLGLLDWVMQRRF